VRILSRWARGRCAIAAARARPADARSLLALGAKDARALKGERWGWAEPLGALLDAGIAIAGARDDARARTLLERAASGLDGVDMALHAAAARRTLGTLVGGDEGRALVAGADAWMTAQGIVSPARMTAMLVPGIDPAA
jgi:hypothetical protein